MLARNPRQIDIRPAGAGNPAATRANHGRAKGSRLFSPEAAAARLALLAASGWKPGTDVAWRDQHRGFLYGGSMSHVTALRNIVGFFERAAFAIIGLVLMVRGLALGVTMIMLPVGVVIGLVGVGMLVAALFAHIDQ
jgi:hypothetical protein